MGPARPPWDRSVLRVAVTLGLHPLAVEDAVQARDRPKLDRYEDHQFVSLMTLRPANAAAPLEVGRVMVFLGEAFVVTVRQEHGDTLERRDSASSGCPRNSPALWTSSTRSRPSSSTTWLRSRAGSSCARTRAASPGTTATCWTTRHRPSHCPRNRSNRACTSRRTRDTATSSARRGSSWKTAAA